ncbi:PREDICTED: cyclin-U4-1-like [Tarenaya hassleriana]|uniref:cyclin-U4-1-like n=1 Tax=Tarenaya hassleriana TaxID=28532 RepID=UPI00053C4B86|nr:PREDICTED: cyclin-U4-1-like [Tarenaya hassleriana]
MAELENPEVMEKLIAFLSSMLEGVAEENDRSRPVEQKTTSAFDGIARPAISIRGYLNRIFKYSKCSPSCVVVAYVYIDRFAQLHPSVPITSFNVHRLLITSFMVSAKFFDDIYYSNAYYAKIGGITTAEINTLELDFLFGLRFRLNLKPNTFHAYLSYLHKEMMLLQAAPIAVGRPLIAPNDGESSHQTQQLAV